mgnify:CR=1 FL=1
MSRKFHIIPEINALFSSTAILNSNRNSSKRAIPALELFFKEKPYYTLFLWQYVNFINFNGKSEGFFDKNSDLIDGLLDKLPHLNIIICCNDKASLEQVPSKWDRLSAILCNHNSTSNRKKFKIETNTPKLFDSVYTARLEDYKRHYLSYNLKNILYLAGYSKKYEKHSEEYKDLLNNQINPMTLCTQRIHHPHLNKFINQSKVGLCLSQREGAMYSSIEYLLCGLPIVSTKSVGGRDVFFTDRNCIIAEDTPESVAECVQKWLDCYPTFNDRCKIRDDAIATQKEYTKNLKNKLKEIATLRNINVDIDKLYKKNFSSSMNWTQKIEVK